MMIRILKYRLSLKDSRGLNALAIILLAFSASCGSSAHSVNNTPKPELAKPSPIDVASLCDRISEIKIFPQKENPVDDPVYTALSAAGEKAIPCLIEKISDTTVMPDPREAPKVTGLRVGDTAYFMFVRIAKIDFVKLFPREVKQEYSTEGIYGYFRTIDENNNRQKLQDAALEWYEQNYHIDLRKEKTKS